MGIFQTVTDFLLLLLYLLSAFEKHELTLLVFVNLNEAGLNIFDTNAFFSSAEISIYLKVWRLMHDRTPYILGKLSCISPQSRLMKTRDFPIIINFNV